MVHRETFLQVHLRTLRHPVPECSAHGMTQLRRGFLCGQARSSPSLEMVIEAKTQSLLRVFLEVRQPEIHSTLWREAISRVMGSTNNDFKSRNFVLTNSLLHKRFRVGRKGSRLRYGILYSINDLFRVTGVNDSVFDYADWCSCAPR